MIRTNANFPKRSPIGLAHSLELGQARVVDISPFVDDIRAAASFWCPALQLPVAGVPHEIGRYQITVQMIYADKPKPVVDRMEGNPLVAVLGLAFGDPSVELLRRSDFWEIVSADVSAMKKKIKLVSAIGWDAEGHEVTFWMEKVVVEKMMEEGWGVCLVRTDNWGVIGEARAMSVRQVQVTE